MVSEVLLRLDELAGRELWLAVGNEHSQNTIIGSTTTLLIARRALRTNPDLAVAVDRVLGELVDGCSGRSRAQLEQALERAVLGGRLSVVWRQRARPRVIQAIVPEHIVPLSDLADGDAERLGHDVESNASETWFEARIVDGRGSPLVGVEVVMLHEGASERLVSDGDGRVRLDGVTSGSATVWVHDTDSLRAALETAWAQPTEEAMLEPSADVEITYYRDDLVGPLVLGRKSPKTLSIQPFVVLGRLTGMLFDTNKSFLLPVSLASIAELRALYDRCAPCQLLVVGHTDTSGQADYNEALSLERAQSVLEYLTDDVDAWLERYDTRKPAGTRWGSSEDLYMIRSSSDFGTREPARDPVRWFQATRGLQEDGIMGPNTRRVLIEEYMARDGTSLPVGVTAEVHGCGEAFPLDRSGEGLDGSPVDGRDDPIDRRVELFFFGDRLGVKPPAPGSTSKAGTTAYPSWRKRAKETHERVIGPRALEIVLHDERGQPVPHARYRVRLPAGAVVDGELDAQGFARIERLPEGVCRVDFPDLRQGFVAESIAPLS
jgi:outer membrane protein OmpA-like peptidoglycan-associated protein